MSYTVKFNTPVDAIRHAMFYNGQAVRKIMRYCRDCANAGKHVDRFNFQIAFSFAGIVMSALWAFLAAPPITYIGLHETRFACAY